MILPLLPPAARPYAKAVIALIGTVVAVLAVTTGNEVLGVIVQVLTALGVYAQPNVDTGIVLGDELDA